MRIIEKTLIIMLIAGMVLKIFAIPGSSVLITISILSLSVLYFLFGFAIFTKVPIKGIFKKISYSHLKPADIITSIFCGNALSTLIVGILFQLNYWLGASPMTFAGMATTLPIIITAIIFLFLLKNRYVYQEILVRTIPFFLLALFLHLTPVSTRLKIFKVYDKNIEAQILEDSKQQNQ